MVKTALIDQLKAEIFVEARRLGFADVGVASAAENAVVAGRLAQWLGDDMHGDMGWMQAREHHRRSPQGLWPEANSVIALAMSYAPMADPLALAAAKSHARISAYAQGADYHDVVKKALKALARWMVVRSQALGLNDASGEVALKVFVDTAPVMEKPLAAAAGLGWQGKHTNMVSQTHGSWLFLGAIYTNLEFAPDVAGKDRCGSCSACQTACPTDAFPAPYRLDARRCISYLTIEHAGPIPLEFRRAMGNRIYGCDDCLAVCPWNKFASAAQANRAFLPRAELATPRLAELLMLDDAGFRQLFSGSPIKRIGRNKFIRNCLIAAGNSGDAALEDVVSGLCADEDAVVAEAARWALGELNHIADHGSIQPLLLDL